ncbi:MAG: hypothetical protein ACFFFG_14100 [Candidatus Thorarchaeota archaeon]
MASIAYFISDHGLGHATRSVAIIRALLECDLGVSIAVYTSKPLPFIRQSLSLNEDANRITFHNLLNDEGYCQAPNGKISYGETAERIHSWINSWDTQYLIGTYKKLRPQDLGLIISDIAPQPFLLAKKLNIIGVAISNFTWVDIYQHPLFNGRNLKALWNAYRQASLGLLLPFNLENTVFPTIFETSMVCRSPTRTSAEMRELLRVESTDQVIYAGTGMSMRNPFREDWLEDSDGIFILGGKTTCNGHNIRLIPSSDTEGQDYIACSDLALIKVGYGSVTEAIRGKVPILGVDFAGTPESIQMAQQIETLGIGRCLNREEYLQGKWRALIPEVLDLKQNYRYLSPRYQRIGENEVADVLLNVLEETESTGL